MAILSVEVDLVMLDQALGGKGLVADFNNPQNKIVLPADGSDVTDEQIITMAKSLEAKVIENIKAAKDKVENNTAAKAALLKRLGITADEAQLILG